MVMSYIKNRFKNSLFSLSGYLVLSIVIIHVLLLPVMYYTLLDSYKEHSYDRFIGHNNEVAGMLSDVISTKDLSNDEFDIIKILESSSLGDGVVYIELIDSNDSTYLYNESNAEDKKFVEDALVNANEDNTYFLSFPVYFKNNKDKISQLKLGFDETNVIEEYEAVKRTTAIILIAYFVAVLVLVSSIIRIIHRPLRLLRSQSKEIADGNLELPLTNTSCLKEIRFLTDDLEKMRGSLVGLAERMQYKATHDELTHLPNRYLFNDRLEQSIAISERENKEFSILLLDLDRFKEINDTLGHGVGDEVLKVVSDRMMLGLRDSDTVARIGGDEFSFILMNVNQILAERIAKKIIELVEPVFEINDHSLKVGASIGVSVFPLDGTDPELLMRRADVAMYNAKHNNLQISSYHPDMDSDHYEKLMLTNDLRSSIDNGLFEPFFQPKISLLTGETCGCELLLRWNHPNLGLIYPDKFIPLAERENLIGDLTRWAISSSLHEFESIVEKNADFHVSINVSPIDLLDAALFESINDILKTINFPEKNLFIEVTENAIMKNPARSADILNKFNNKGIVVSIDDFGTGYSSLSYLQKFPISELKIDKSFIYGLTKESNNYPIVSATITMAHDLGIVVVAEGVESQSVIDLLKEMGCDRVQGYHFSHPLNVDGFKQWLADQS
ncbi:MAG: hypothetical protein DIZ80_00795 [endosymbiont of Galathealinum brachiosum]|uniref:GGDEF domain-containing protein n=1 Tax=endosymbiont of Galathealinum brachiosum TaxID=2200906 RepID=A0A370DMA1_9GAMM|nr:MAG: hypothetical protein DIZ80_00795 [endosymbiont of Galathealinum brachiosum]